jgi:hypothetical protein
MLINATADNKYRAMRNDRSSGSLRATLKYRRIITQATPNRA